MKSGAIKYLKTEYITKPNDRGNRNMKRLKDFLNMFIISAIISLIFFYKFDINIVIYSILSLFLWILIFLNYRFEKNIELFDNIIVLSIANLSVYIVIGLFIHGTLEDRDFIPISIYILLLGLISLVSYFNREKDKFSKKEKNLLRKREKDLDRLLNYINKFNIVGLNGEWGTGKSFLIDKFKDKVRDEYEIIEIDLLSCNLNELQLILIKELEKVMNENRIMSKYSNDLKNYLNDNKFTVAISNLLFSENNTYSKTIEGFRKEIGKLDKKIIIIYEDIDRISEKHIIKKIFGISEKLSSSNIKVIYQYDENNLKNIGFTDRYIEKYIPFKMNLTELDFFEILKFILSEENIDENILEFEDFKFIKPGFTNYRYNVLSEELNKEKEYSVHIKSVSMRKVENFLFELCNILEISDEFKNNKETTISFFIVKFFFPFVYEQLNIEKGLIDTLKFEKDKGSYTILDLISLYKLGGITEVDIEIIFEDEKNKINYGILKMFNYKNIIFENNSNYEERMKSIVEEPVDELIGKNSNDKKDRLIWNLLAAGKSEYTNYEYVANLLIEKVLEKPESEQIEAYNKLSEDLHYHGIEDDNKTIFLMGIPSFIELFKSFRILDVDHKKQLALINLYINKKNIKSINMEFIRTINYCSIDTKEKYLSILDIIVNKLNIEMNFNSEEYFIDFLKRIIDNLSYPLGYINTREYFKLFTVEKVDDNKKIVIKELENINKRLLKLKNRINSYVIIDDLNNEIDLITSFIEKMIRLIKCEKKSIKNKTPGFKSEISFRNTNQEEIDRIKNSNNIKEEIISSYSQGKIKAYEVDKLIGR